jgi:hypothetical protein
VGKKGKAVSDRNVKGKMPERKLACIAALYTFTYY